MEIRGSSLIIGLIFLQFTGCLSYKILALAPHYGESHWYIFRSLLNELAKRGNDVTAYTHFRGNESNIRYRDLSIRSLLQLPKYTNVSTETSIFTRIATMRRVLKYGVEGICAKGLQDPQLRELMKSNDTFDVLIIEIFNADCLLGFVHKFQAPLVALRSAPLSPWSNDRMGNPDNPSYIPGTLMGKPTRMNLWDRLENFIGVMYYKTLYAYYDRKCQKIAREFFGNDLPALSEIARNTSMLLVNSHFVMQQARPLVNGIKEIAGMHLGKPKELPQEMEDWISGAKDGVIYFSLGSMIRTSTVAIQKRKILLEVFAQLSQRVLMKWDDDSHNHDIPDNIMLFNWTQQYDVLCHPNVKIFISHCGMLSTTEAVYSATPVIAIPIYGDQPTNAALLEERGMAIVLQYDTFTKDQLLSAVKRILNEPQYQETASMMSRVVQDRLVPPVEEAAYWVEYVARHNGAKFMRSPALDLPLYQYLLLDVLAILFLTVLVVLTLLFLLLKFLVRLIVKPFGKSPHKNQGKPTKRD